MVLVCLWIKKLTDIVKLKSERKMKMKKNRIISAVSALLLTIPFGAETIASAEQVDPAWLWQRFIDNGMTEAGAAGVVANLKAESALLSENLQDTYEDYLGYSDYGYVWAVDNYAYNDFVYDEAGFGLPQFTYYARKDNFLRAVRDNNASIASKEVQVDFIMEELRNEYPSLLYTLQTTDSVYEAASSFMCEYEQPADQSYGAIEGRYDLAAYYYNKYANGYAPSYTPSYNEYDIVGDTVMFNGTNHHTSAWDGTAGSYCGSGMVQITDVCQGSPYSLHAVSVDGGSCWGWISASEISYDTPAYVEPSAPELIYEPVQTEPVYQNSGSINVGDIMMFNGNTHHLSAFDTTGGSYCTSGQVQITDIYYDGNYQYHAVGIDGSSCWGWVSANDLSPVGGSAVTTYEPAPTVVQSGDIQIGSTVYFYGGGHYSWSGADSPEDYPPAGKAVVTNIVEGSEHPYHIVHADDSSWVYGYCDADSIEFLY